VAIPLSVPYPKWQNDLPQGIVLLRVHFLILRGHLGGGAVHQFDATPLWAEVLHLAVEYLECQSPGRFHIAAHICRVRDRVHLARSGVGVGVGTRICVMGRRHEFNFPGQIHRFVIWFTSNAAYLYRRLQKHEHGQQTGKRGYSQDSWQWQLVVASWLVGAAIAFEVPLACKSGSLVTLLQDHKFGGKELVSRLRFRHAFGLVLFHSLGFCGQH